MNWTSHAISHPGNRRKYNQDAYFCHDKNGVWAIADGMGGHEAGEIASQTIVQSLANLTQSGAHNSHILNITSILEDVNQQLYRQNSANERMVGSTIAMVQANQNNCTCLWAGDSRIYHYRDQHLQQLSVDHSYVQELINQGELSIADAESHAQRNVITRAIGVSENLDIEAKQFELQTNDLLLICSDGLYNEVAEAEIAAILEYSKPADAIKRL
jgi:serine/threonine protein phosphatase PrpC